MKYISIFVALWLTFLSPTMALAQEAGPQEPTGLSGPIGPQGETGTGPVGCVGSDCPIEVSGTNSNTGEGSTNTVESDVNASDATAISNSADDATKADLVGTTGSNTNTGNTGDAATTTGNAGIGVTSVKNDNTAVIGGSAGLDVTGYNGNYTGDYTIGFGSSTADLSGGGSYRAINDTTGANSTNTVDLNTDVEELNEVQNDGKILNDLVLKALTGQNEVNANTGDATITTGDADIAATLVNLLNSTVINGSLMVSVADIFGDLMGNIVLPDLAALAAGLRQGYGGQGGSVDAVNENTGENSTNTIDVDLRDTEKTSVDNDAKVTTTMDADAITGQNEALANTGGGFVNTGDGSVSLANLTLANTTVEGGNWGLVIVNAFNRWLGFLVGDSGEVRGLTQDETIEAINRQTGANSTNEIAITNERERITMVENDAVITNEIDAQAITGQNKASLNTGAGIITTGDANIQATAVNIANTTVKDASLFIAVVNIFGDWFGDLLYGGSSLLASAGGSQQVNVDAANQNTGAESENTVEVNVDRSHVTDINNNAKLATTLNANIDTGTNKTNKNTLGGNIETGNGILALHSRALANLTGIALDPVLGLTISGLNEKTGFDSKNKISAEINDERIISIDNFADVNTIFASLVNTGNNEANQNTIGGNILTGNIDANVGIHNLVNRVILALADGLGFAAGDHVIIDADFLNRLTGALSENLNEAGVNYDFLAEIDNKALIDNILDLIFNTGGNQANDNTFGAATVTGRICFEGRVRNEANQNTLGLGVPWSVSVANDADVQNDADFQVTTGNNQMANNTGGGAVVDSPQDCEKQLAEAVPSPTPPAAAEASAGKQAGGEKGDGQGGGEAEQIAEFKPTVLAAKAEPKQPRIGNGILTRFPVAGGEATGVWLEGKTPLVWPLFLLLSIVGLGVAWGLDRRWATL